MLVSMGFTEAQARKALQATDNNLERAADWIFSHADELDAMDTDQVKAKAEKEWMGGRVSIDVGCHGY